MFLLHFLPILISCQVISSANEPVETIYYSQFYWTLVTLMAVLLGVGVLLYIHACLLRIRDEERYIVYETAPLIGTTKIPPPPKYEQVI